MNLDTLYADAIAGDAVAIAKLEMEADKLNQEKYTILHTEAQNGNAERVRFILREFAHTNLLTKSTRWKHTALHKAIYDGHTEVAEVLIHAARDLPPSSFQAFLRQADKYMNTALHAAVMKGNVPIVKQIVEADPTDTHIQNYKGKTPMYMAVEKGYNDIVEIISTTCTDPSLDGPYGSFAVRIENLDQVKSPGGTLYKIIPVDAVYAAAIAGDADAKAKLEMAADKLYEEDKTCILHTAAFRGELGRVQYILRELAHKNLLVKLTKRKNTALHYAVSDGSAEVVKVLIDAARNLPSSSSANNETDDNSVSPFQAFLRQGNERLLTALHIAVRKRDVALVELLVKADPSDRHIQDSQGKTPMYLAAERGYFDLVKIMCTTCTVPINLDGPGGTTALHAVIKNLDKDKKEERDLIRLIINAVKIVNIPEDAESLLSDQINRERDERLVQLFKKTDQDRCTILELAVEQNYADVVELILAENPAYQNVSIFEERLDHDMVGLLPLIYKAGDKEYRDVLELLNQRFKTRDKLSFPKENMAPLLLAIRSHDLVEEICTTCTSLSLDGPGGRTTALHALVQSKTGQGVSDVIRIIVNAAKRWSSADFEALFSRTDESESTVLQLAVEKNNVDAVRLILQEDPAYQQGREIKRNSLMRLIYKAIDNNCSDDIIKLLSQTYEAGIINPDHKDVVSLILAMKRRDEDSVLRLLGGAKDLVTFTEDNGWTPLHYAVYHEFDSVLGAIIGAQEDVGHQFVYGNMVPTPFHLAVKSGYASTLVLLMKLWPASSSEIIDANSPYTAIDENDRNILHLATLAATDNKKEMVQGILRYCPNKYKEKILQQQDINGDTPLHLLIAHGCFIPELIKHKGLDTMAKNKYNFTPRDMLYFKNEIVADQVHIKIALDDVQTNQSTAWNLWAKNTEKETNIWKSIVPPSKRRIKDVIFDERKKLVMNAKYEQMKKDVERYKMRTNTQIIVAALITTVTFTVGFTMPGGLRQSGEVHEGSVILTRKAVFNAFMVSDALALLLSTCSLFLYFLESMYEDPHQVRKLNAASVGLNIVSIMAMMLTFITGTYLVLSHSPALAITVCLIGSFFLIFVIVLLIKFVSDRRVKRNED